MAQDGRPEGGTLRRLPLHEEHERLGARLAPFAGWSMPLQYGSIIDEHLQVRCLAGLFDVSHMGRILLRGPGAVDTMQRLVASDLQHLSPGEARYTVLMNDEGGIRDDLIVYRREEGLLLVVNAGTAAADRLWVEENLIPGTELDDLTELTSLFALQGPRALGLVSSLADSDLGPMHPFTFLATTLAGIEATVMRTGYTGEEGVELMVVNTDALALWQTLLSAGRGEVAPAGLGARDTLRLEAALLLYGQDVTWSTSPFEARLGWLVDLDRPDFVGRPALRRTKEMGPARLLVGLATDAHTIPRHGDTIHDGDRLLGRVTSGTLSPVLGHPIALGYVTPDHARPGLPVTLQVRSRAVEARVIERPFYKRGETPLPDRAPCSEEKSEG
jgi:aminomethyltransferase